MKKTPLILTFIVALVVQVCFLQQLVTAHVNESLIAHRMMEHGHPERSYSEPYFTGYFNRDVYAAAVMSNDVYEDQSTAYTLVPEYTLVYRYHKLNSVFNIYVSASEKKLVISFRGSAGYLLDWIQNIVVVPIPYPITPNKLIWIHAGFLDEILEYKQILRNFVIEYSGYSIIWTGHSQGGALAQVAATLIGQELSIPIDRSRLITFGSPAAGNSDFANFAAQLVKHTRIVNAFPCYLFDCFEVDIVSVIIPFFEHFGEWFPMKTRYDDYFSRHSMTNYQIQVKKREMFYDLISLSVNPTSIIYQQSSRIYYQAYEITLCNLYANLILYFKKSGSTQQAQLPCTTNGAIEISSLPPGEYNLQGMVSGYPILTFPSKLNIASPPFQCPFSCNGCDYISNNCTSCINGFYGPLCQFYCNSNCLSCKSGSSCLTCKNPAISSPPTCAPKCSNCVNGQCIEGQCVCNSGYGGANCTSIICPSNCLRCSSPYLCSSCLPRTFGATCSFTCIPNCLTCSDDKTCTKCDAGYSGSTCTTGPNYFYTSIGPINTGFTGSYSLPYRIRYVDPFGYFNVGIGNRKDVIFSFSLPTSNTSPSQSLIFNNASYAPFIGISGYNDKFISTTSVQGVLLVTPSVTVPTSIPNTPSMIYNTGINETFINIQTNYFFSFFLTNAGNVRSFGEISSSTSGCYPSGFFGIYKTNFTKLAIPQKISLISCSPSNYICFAYSRESRRLYGWGTISYAYYNVNPGLCQYTPLELDVTTFGSEIILSITVMSSNDMVMYVMESGKVFYTGAWGSLSRPSYPTLLSPTFIGTSERIITATYILSYSSIMFTTYSGKNFVTSNFYKYLYPSSNPTATGNLWDMKFQLTERMYYSATTCNGMFDFDPAVCSGNGVCEEFDMCYCKTGYSGNNCEIPTCYGKRADVASVCSGVGLCFGPNNCSCQYGYNGTNCEISSSNCIPSSANCQSCKTGFYDTSKLCNSKCMLNCAVCSSGETCDSCLGDMKGPNCNEKVCKVSNCASCSTVTGLCLECNDGRYDDYCNSTCPSNCKSCSAESTCTTCQPGWSGSQCNIPVCNENCLECSSPNQCSRCLNGLYGSDCSQSCLSECESCTNSTSCFTCPPFSSGSKCEIQTENCLSLINSPPTVSVFNLGSSMIMYSISVSNILSKSSNMTRISFSEISTCERNSSDLVVNSTIQLTCESQYSIVISISDLISDSKVTQQLDASGVVLTLTVPIYIGLISNTGYCQVTNYKVDHQIKLLLSSHQYIDMAVMNSNSSISQISFRREVLSVSNNKLKVSGTLFSQRASIEGVVFVKSEPLHNVSFDISFQLKTSGEYYMTILAREYLSYYSGDFTFQVYAKSPEGDVYRVPLYISLSYYMPINPPPSEFKLLTQLGLFSDNFKEAKNLFQLSERPHVVVKVLDTFSKPASLQNTVRISIKNAYLCCVNSGRPMPAFDLQNGQLGCTFNNPLLMTSWHQLIRNQSEILQYGSSIIKFPFVNNQIAFSFKLSSQMFSYSSYGTVNDCFIHTETILTNDGISARRQASSVVENFYHST